jgi:hypothetical protein
MAGDRYVLLGLARPRVDWFRAVGQWSTSAALPAEFLKCVSVEELRIRLGSGRPYSAVLLDAGMAAVDRDLLDTARDAGCAVLVVDDGHARHDWLSLGASVVLPAALDRDLLIEALADHAPTVGRGGASPLDGPPSTPPLRPGRALLAVVCGPGGTGASTGAAALAQGLGSQGPSRGVVLVDLARHAEQAMLHDVRDVVPGIQELVEAHRSGRPSAEDVRALDLRRGRAALPPAPGLRQARSWTTVRARSFEASLTSLRSTFGAVVCDVTADFESEDDGGSADVEERNLMARTAVRSADVVFAVGRPGVKGVHALVRVLADLAGAGVPPARTVPVFNAAPRHPRARAELAAALAELAVPVPGSQRLVGPLFLPVRKVEAALRDAVLLPAPLPAMLAGAFGAVVERCGPAADLSQQGLERVEPGAIGHWGDADDMGATA